jgi:predicted dehydrogenase
MKKKLNIGIIGSGFMGRAHSFAWANVNRFFDTDFEPVLKVISFGSRADLAHEFAGKQGWEDVAPDWETLVGRDDIDIVDICAPTWLHHDMFVAAAEKGKHIFCEKPAALTYAEAKDMAETADKAGIVHYLNHNYRTVPAIAFAKKLIDDGRLGTIYHWRSAYLQDWIMSPDFPLTWHFHKEKAGGGPLYDLNSHSVDMARFLVGEIDAVMGINKTFIDERPLPGKQAGTFTAGGDHDMTERGAVTVDDASFFVADFAEGALGSFDATRFGSGRKNWKDFEIYGSKGGIKFNFESMNEIRFLDLSDPDTEQGYKRISVTTGDHPYAGAWWGPGHIIGYENTFFHAIANFLNAIANGSQVSPNLHDGSACIRVLEAVAKSSKEKRRVEISEIG